MTGLIANFKFDRPEMFGLDISISIPDGTTVALLGPNGSGKSTLVAILSGLLAIDRGRIELGGRILDDPEQGIFVEATDRNVGVVFQDYLLFPRMSARKNVEFSLVSKHVSRADVNTETDSWLNRLGLESVAGQMPGTLSGGEAQRVALARALISSPDLLLLDEPLAALDVRSRSGLQQTVKRHLEVFRGPRLFITHDPREAFLFADQIHIIEKGVITQSGSPDDIRLRPITAYAADIAGGWSHD